MRTTILLVLAIGLMLSPDSFAQRGKGRLAKAAKNGWTVLGSKNVDWKVEKDVLHVGASEGTYTKLKIKVTGGPVYINSMVVTYGNGTKDNIPLKYQFKKGAESRVIDLKGGKRVIKKIAFVYNRKNITRGAKVWVAGRR